MQKALMQKMLPHRQQLSRLTCRVLHYLFIEIWADFIHLFTHGGAAKFCPESRLVGVSGKLLLVDQVW